MQAPKNKIVFHISNSLIDSAGGRIPIFLRSSPTTIERKNIKGGTSIEEVPSHRPAICSEDGAIVLHPESRNEVSWNANPSHSSWLKGSNVSVLVDRSEGVDRTYLAEKITWSAGSGDTQSIKKNLYLEAATTYTLSLIARIQNGSGLFRPGDLISVTGGVTGAAERSLSLLNKGDSDKITFSFTTSGGSPQIPSTQVDYLPVLTNTNATFTIGIAGINANSLVGSQVIFAEIDSTFLVVSNTASDNLGATTIEVDSPTLIVNGINNQSKVKISKPPLQLCTVQLSCDNTVVMEWGAIQIEPKNFATAAIVQKENLEHRDDTVLRYGKTPWADLANFAIFGNIKRWVGDGNLLDAEGDIKIEIIEGKLKASVKNIALTDTENLPESFKFLLQVSPEGGFVTLYIDKRTVASSSISNFIGNKDASIDLSSPGIREIFSLTVLEGTLRGNVPLGQVPRQEVLQIFDREPGLNIVSGRSLTEMILPPTTVPALRKPPSTKILQTNNQNYSLTVFDSSIFSIGKSISIKNEGIFILKGNIVDIEGNNVFIDTPTAIVSQGYDLIQGEDAPGRATMRFPFDPIDIQRIVGVAQPPVNSVSVANSTLSFAPGPAIVQDESDRYVTEVIITSIKNQDKEIALDSVEGIGIGYKISQANSQLEIDPNNYLVSFSESIDGISLAEVGQNGIVVENYNDEPISVTAIITPIL